MIDGTCTKEKRAKDNPFISFLLQHDEIHISHLFYMSTSFVYLGFFCLSLAVLKNGLYTCLQVNYITTTRVLFIFRLLKEMEYMMV